MTEQEEKARFFAQYWGQGIVCKGMYEVTEYSNICVDSDSINRLSIIADNDKFYSYLQLKPLSQITDEDAVEVASLCGCIFDLALKTDNYVYVTDKYNDEADDKDTLRLYFKSEFELFLLDDEGKVFDFTAEQILEVCDYLRSKSYLIPFGGKSVEEILSLGWSKYDK